MKKIKFTKMAGAGNGFVVVEKPPIDLKKLVINVCSPKSGLGTDGLLVLDSSKKADYRMRILNADGSEAEMCGNGARCLAAYIAREKSPKKKTFSIETLAGIVLAQAKGETANIRLSDPKHYQSDIPIAIGSRRIKVDYIDTGVPHAVVFVEGIDGIDVDIIGRAIRLHEQFSPRGTNVDFSEQMHSNFIKVRTFERGVEGETLACGTGSVAAAITTFLKTNPEIKARKEIRINVQTLSGEVLGVSFDLDHGRIYNVWLKGSAKFIAKGEYYVK